MRDDIDDDMRMEVDQPVSHVSGLIDGIEDTSDLSTSLIATNLDLRIFSDEALKTEFERVFKDIDIDCTFQYFKSFKRARINFSSQSTAAQARIQCQQRRVGDTLINCYYIQTDADDSDTEDTLNRGTSFLKPPPLEKQFLISPPASPPVGWEPVNEATPLINFELLAALSNLAPGQAHTLHPESEDQPGIVVHICCEDEGLVEGPDELSSGMRSKKIVPCPTPRPPSSS